MTAADGEELAQQLLLFRSSLDEHHRRPSVFGVRCRRIGGGLVGVDSGAICEAELFEDVAEFVAGFLGCLVSRVGAEVHQPVDGFDEIKGQIRFDGFDRLGIPMSTELLPLFSRLGAREGRDSGKEFNQGIKNLETFPKIAACI